MPLHVDHRPKTLEEVIGNESIKNSLKSIFTREDRPHAFLFYGPSGSGKTTFGRIIANMLKCDPSDTFEYNSANTRGIETIRQISENVHYSAMMGKVKVYILDEAASITGAGANALLKVLEEPPRHVYFILCTTEPEKLLKTIRTRCTAYQTSLLNNPQMKDLLNQILKKEQIEDFPKSVFNEIIRVSGGCPRQSLVVLDSVIDIEDEKEALEAVSIVTVGEAEVIEICRAIIKREPWKSIRGKVKEVLTNTEPEKVRYAILGYMTSVLLNHDQDDRISEIIDLFSENTFSSGKAGLINAIYLSLK